MLSKYFLACENLLYYANLGPMCVCMIKKSTDSDTATILIKNPSEDDKQSQRRSFTLKCKHELFTKIESCHAFSASLDEACWQ